MAMGLSNIREFKSQASRQATKRENGINIFIHLPPSVYPMRYTSWLVGVSGSYLTKTGLCSVIWREWGLWFRYECNYTFNFQFGGDVRCRPPRRDQKKCYRVSEQTLQCIPLNIYHQTSNIRHALIGNKLDDHSHVIGAPPVGAAPLNYIFILDFTPGFIGYGNGKTATRNI